MRNVTVSRKGALFTLDFTRPRQPRLACGLGQCGCRINTFVWVSHRLRCIYLETPKAACTSIKKALGIRMDNLHAACAAAYFERTYGAGIDTGALTPDGRREFTALMDLAHTKTLGSPVTTPSDGEFSMFNGTADEALRTYPDYFSFVFVRNPFKKIVSTWQMFCQSANPFRSTQIKTQFGDPAADITLHRFVEKISSVDNHHWNPYLNYFPVSAAPEFVGRLETLTADWAYVTERLGIVRPLPHENRSRSVPAAFTPGDIDTIETLYRADIDAFHYRQGPA